jgi:cell division septation protein DedD
VPPKKKPSSRIKPHSTTFWLFLIFFASAWTFVVGIFVGRGTAPVKFNVEKLEKELLTLKEAVIKKGQDSFKIPKEPVQKETELGFYEALKDNPKETRPSVSLPVPPKKSSGKERVKNKATSVKVSPKREKLDPKPQKGKTAAAAKTAELGTSYTIQVAALKDRIKADKLVADLQKKGYPAYRSTGKVPGKGTWYRIRIGNYKNRADAGSTMSRLKKERRKGILVKR